MDFKRIAWIFFFAFLGVNVFLYNIYHEAGSEQTVVYRSDQKIPIEKRLDSENISYDHKFSNEEVEGYYLSGQPTDMKKTIDEARDQKNDPNFLKAQSTIKDSKLLHTMKNKPLLTDTKETKKTMTKFLEENDELILGNDYHYMGKWSVWSEDYPRIFAAQMYEGIPIHDDSSMLSITLNREGDHYQLISYTQTHVSELMPLREAMSLYTEKDAINTLYVNNKIPANATIKWQQLAYTLTLKVRGKNVYVPAWFVAIETEDGVHVEQVNALTNRIVTNSTVQTVENS